MSLDGIMLSAIKNDLEEKLISSRIDKIYQVNKNLITITARNNNTNHQLLISAHPHYPRLHLSKLKFENPQTPPGFCMLLRKYILRGIIKSIEQPKFERIIIFNIEIHNKLYSLIIEIMGRYSNIVLVNEKKEVVDSIRRITENISSKRQLYPGIKYIFPPGQNKLNPLMIKKKDFFAKIPGNFEKAAHKAILFNFRGIGPDSAREIIFRAGVDPQKPFSSCSQMQKEKILLSFNKYFKNVKRKEFKLVTGLNKDDNISYFSAFPLNHTECSEIDFKNSSSLLDYYYINHIKNKDIKSLKKELNNIISTYLEKNFKKQEKFLKQLKNALSAEDLKKKGELITANIYRLKKGILSCKVEDYYNQGEKITIKMDPQKTPSENAQYYFKKYNKSKKSIKHLKKQIGILKHEERYLNQVELNINQAENKEDFVEIKEELKDEGYIKKQKHSKNKSKNNSPLSPHKFKSSEGYDILAGRNNRQNDHLTKQIANKEDIWLHVKDIAGSHIIIRNHSRNEIPQKTLKEAAVIAAYYSKGRLSENVPVDYTEVKNVNKPRGAKPGLVYYENYQTLYANPNLELVKKLKQNQ